MGEKSLDVEAGTTLLKKMTPARECSCPSRNLTTFKNRSQEFLLNRKPTEI